MKIEFNNKVVVVTGGSGGIGKVCAKTLLESGAKVALVDIGQETLNKVIEELLQFGEVKGYVLDIACVEKIGEVVTEIRNDLGEIDVLVQAAGLMKTQSGLDLNKDSWDLMMNINARGLYFMMQEVVKQSMKQNGGAILNFSSAAAIRGFKENMASPHYSASKAAAISMSTQAAVEWGEYGVRVNSIVPGGVMTEAMAKLDFTKETFKMIPLKKLSDPQDIANVVTFLVSDKAAMITGQSVVVDGGSSMVGF